jgi:L-ascorbate metabolism protein UlaG (beta-lactamase superfamily)
MAAQGVPEEQLLPVAGGETIRLSPEVTVDVYPSQHSCVWSSDPLPKSDAVCIGELGVTYQEQQEKMKGLWEQLSAIGDDGGALVYLFDTPEGKLLYQDTSGHWEGILHGLRPHVAILAAAGRGNIDGEPVQGTLAQFVAQQAALLRPRRVILSHHDDWLPGFSKQIDVTPIKEEMARRAPHTELVDLGYMDGYEIFAGK